MGLLYKVLDKELLKIRNEVFLKKGIPRLKEKGFIKSPFSTAWFGKNNLGDYTYELCRYSNEEHLEIITTHISKGDRWIKIFLNIFELSPQLKSIDDLNCLGGLEFCLAPNKMTKMRLREDDFKGMPLFNFVHHKIGSYKSKSGFEKRIHELGNLIERDLNNIDSFVKRWHEIHEPLVTDWQGHPVVRK